MATIFVYSNANTFRINKEFLTLAQSKMANFDDKILNSENGLEAKLREFRCERKNSDWSLKIELESRLDKFETVVENTNDKVRKSHGSIEAFAASRV